MRLEKVRRGKIEIPITLSDGDKSSFQKVESDHDERINLGDRLEHQNLIGNYPHRDADGRSENS